MVTALIFGKPAPRSVSTSATTAREKEKDDEKRERERTASAALKPSSSSTNNHDIDNQKRGGAAHNQRRHQNNNSVTNGLRLVSSSPPPLFSTQIKISPLTKINAYAATATGQKVQNGESIPLMTHRGASWPPSSTNDKAKGTVNSNSEKIPENKIAAAALPAKAPEDKLTEEETWIKTFNDLKEYRKVHRRVPSSADYRKIVDETGLGKWNPNLAKWMFKQRYQYGKYIEGRESTLNSTHIDLLRSIGLFTHIPKKVASFAFHCAEHSNVYTSNVAKKGNNNPTSTYNISRPASKKHKSNAGELSTNPSASVNGTKSKCTLKSQHKGVSNREEHTQVSNREDDDVAKVVKLVAGAVTKEIHYLGLHSSTDHVDSAIKRFAVEVYCPLLYSSREQSMGISSYSVDRLLLSTLLALREMLVINAEKFFPFAALKDSCTKEEESGEEANANSKITRDFANAVVQNAAKRLQRMSTGVFLKGIIPNQDRLFDQYLEASKSFDSKGEDFQFALGRLGATAEYRNAKGSKLGERESIMARTSFNYAREQHPLIREDSALVGQKEAHAAPNACAVFVMEESEIIKKKEDTGYTTGVNVEARHVERKEARETRIRLLKRHYSGLS